MCALQSVSASVPQELVRDVHSWALLRPTDSETPGVWPSLFCQALQGILIYAKF